MVDAKSPYTCGHSARVAIYSERIAAVLGLPVARQQWIKRAAFLHDIGKLGVDSQVLDKPGKLDAAEWTAVKTHAAYTEEILSGISAFAELAKVAGAHHEKLDGSGYPRGLKGDEICIEARIITVADIFDAITAARPYRTAITPARAIEMMEESAGTQLDSRCVAALKKSVRLRDRGGCAASTISA